MHCMKHLDPLSKSRRCVRLTVTLYTSSSHRKHTAACMQHPFGFDQVIRPSASDNKGVAQAISRLLREEPASSTSMLLTLFNFRMCYLKYEIKCNAQG
jgi:hypothetical protein